MFHRARNLSIAVITLLAAGVAGLAVAGIVLVSGVFSVSAVPPHLDVTETLLHFAFKRSVAFHAGDHEPPEDLMSEGRILLGGQHYVNACSKCHGGPDLGQNPMALSMRPRPQHLPKVVGQFDDEELFWIVKNGVRFSAMPSWPAQARDDEIWSVVAFLRTLPEMTSEDYAALAPPEVENASLMPFRPEGERQMKVPPNSGGTDEQAYFAPTTEWTDFAMNGHPVRKCVACHGIDGTGEPTRMRAPNLSIQTADYLAASLRSYADRTRRSGIMETVATDLTEPQIEALAQYFANLPDRAAGEGSADLATLEAGRKIAEVGLPDKAVPGCLSCHGRGNPEGPIEVPRLAGQSATYILTQLHAFDEGGRGATGIYNPMPDEAHALTDGEEAAVAAYFAAQDPGQDRPQTFDAVADEASRETFSQVCSECHTADATGSAEDEVPNLTLQTPAYIAQRLHEFRLGESHATQMDEVARRQTDADIAALAAYIGGMPARAGEAGFSDDLLARGETIAKEGDQGVPACLSCHAEGSTSLLPLISRLHGQHQTYLRKRLDYFSSDTAKRETMLNPMPDIAPHLSDDDREAVAAWFAAQSPLPKGDVRTVQ